MNQNLALTSTWKALAGACALLAAVHGAQAAPPQPGLAEVKVIGQLPLRQACPGAADGELADALAAAWDDADKPSAVAVSFQVQRHHVYAVAPATTAARTFHQIRHAVHRLSCDGGDDEAHAVRFVVRFVEAGGDRRMATITDDAAR